VISVPGKSGSGQSVTGVDQSNDSAPLTSLVDGATGRLMDPKLSQPGFTAIQRLDISGRRRKLGRGIEYVHTLGLHENKTVNTIRHRCFGNGSEYRAPIITSIRDPFGCFLRRRGVPVLGRVMDEQSVNRSRYDGLNTSYRQHMTKHFSLNANYTLPAPWDGALIGSPDGFSIVPELPA